MKPALTAGALVLLTLLALPSGHAQMALMSGTPADDNLSAADNLSLAELLADVPPEHQWDVSGGLKVSAGFKDNVLLSAVHRESSPFVRTDAELMAWRLPTDRLEASFFGSGSLTRFTSSDDNPREWETFAHGDLKWLAGPAIVAGLTAEGYAMNQVFDVSATSAERVSTSLRVTGARGAGSLRWNTRTGFWLELEPSAQDDTYRDGSDDNREYVLKLSAGRVLPGGRAKLTFSALGSRRDYDSREQFDLTGLPVAGSALSFGRREARAGIEFMLDAAKRWRSTTEISSIANDDNGTGWFDYREMRLSQILTWNRDVWNIRATARYGRIDHDRQTVDTGGTGPLRNRDEFTGQLRVGIRATERLTLFGDGSWERNNSNDPLATYTVTMASAGVDWAW